MNMGPYELCGVFLAMGDGPGDALPHAANSDRRSMT